MILVRLIYFWSWQTSVATVVRELGVSEWTTIDWYNFYHDICMFKTYKNVVQIGGPGKIVKLYELKFTKAKYNRGRNVRMKDGWVQGGIKMGSRLCFLKK